MPLLPPQLRLLYPSLPLTRLPPFLHQGFGLGLRLGFSKSRTLSTRGRVEVRASKSLIEDEEELSNWVTGLRTSSFRSGAVTEDEDEFDRGGKGKRGGRDRNFGDVEENSRGREGNFGGGRGGRGGYDRNSSNVGSSRRSSDGNSRFGGGNDRRGGGSSYSDRRGGSNSDGNSRFGGGNDRRGSGSSYSDRRGGSSSDGDSRFGNKESEFGRNDWRGGGSSYSVGSSRRGGLGGNSYNDRSPSRNSSGNTRFGDRDKRGGLSSNSFSDRSSSRNSSGNSRVGGGMERERGGREGGRGRGGGRMSSRGGRSGGRGGFSSEEEGVDEEFGVYEGRKGKVGEKEKSVSGFLDLIGEDDSEEDVDDESETESEGEEIEEKSRSSLFGNGGLKSSSVASSVGTEDSYLSETRFACNVVLLFVCSVLFVVLVFSLIEQEICDCRMFWNLPGY